MTTPEVTLCADGHYRRVIYGLGPYIADYPEQVLLACVVQGWCPRYVTVSAVFTSNGYLTPSAHRCTAYPDDLDGDITGRRSHEHTCALLDAFDLKTLWDEYGVVGDLVVSVQVLQTK